MTVIVNGCLLGCLFLAVHTFLDDPANRWYTRLLFWLEQRAPLLHKPAGGCYKCFVFWSSCMACTVQALVAGQALGFSIFLTAGVAFQVACILKRYT